MLIITYGNILFPYRCAIQNVNDFAQCSPNYPFSLTLAVLSSLCFGCVFVDPFGVLQNFKLCIPVQELMGMLCGPPQNRSIEADFGFLIYYRKLFSTLAKIKLQRNFGYTKS